MKTRTILTTTIALLVASTAATRAADFTATWNGTIGNWTDVARWSTNPVFPNNGVNTFDAVQNGGTVTVNQDITIEKLTMSGGTKLGGGFTLTLNDLFTWTGGTMSDAGITQANGGVTFSGAGSMILFNGHSLRLGDDSSWSSGTLQFHAGAAITNESGNTFTNSFDGNLAITLSGTGGLNNEGTFTKSGGTGVTNFGGGVFLNNSGTVNVNSGTLQLNTSATSTGIWNVGAGNTLRLAAGTHALNAGTDYNGLGTIEITGATVTANAPVTMDPAVTFSSGTINGTATLTTAGHLTFTGGTMSDAGVTQANGGVTFSGAGNKILFTGRSLRLGDDSTWSEGALVFQGGAAITNESGQVFTNTFDGNLSIQIGGGGGLHNEGTFTKGGGAGVTNFGGGVFLNNSGTVNVNSGTLQLTGGGTSTGAWNVAGGTMLNFANSHTLNAGTSVGGLGIVRFSAGTTNFNAGSYAVAGTTQINGGTANFNAAASTQLLDLSSGALGGTGTLTVGGLTTFTGGVMTGAGITQANGGVSFSGAGNMDISTSRTLNLGAASTWSSGTIRVGLAGVLDIPLGVTLTNSFDGTLTNNLGGNATVNNAGSFTKSAGTGTTSVGAAGGGSFHNTGTVNVDSGTLSFGFGGTHTGTYNVGAGNTLRLAGGTHVLNTGADYNGAGTIEIAGATVTASAPVTMDPAVTFSSGTINGTATLTTAGHLTFTGGTMSDAGVTQANGGVTFSGAGNKSLVNGRSLRLGDDSTWSGGALQFHAGAAITNENGNTFTNSFDGSLSITLSGTGGLNNEGTFTKSGGTGVTNFGGGVFLNNSGTVNVNSGTLQLNTSATSTGIWNVGAGNTLRLAAGTHALNAGTDYNGLGTIEIAGATVTANVPVTMDPAVTFSSGTINGTATLTTAGHLTFTGGTMSDAGVTQANGGVTFSGAGNKILFTGRSLRLGDDSTWSEGALVFQGGAAITNESGQVFTNTFDGNLSIQIGGGGGLHNEGTFTKSGGAGVTNFGGGVFLNNTGTVNANSGTITVQGGVTQHVGTTLTAGTWNVRNGASINVTTGSNITTNQGTVLLDGAGSSFDRLTTALNNNQGSFTIKNDRDLTTAGAYLNSGTTRIEDAPTALTIGAGAGAAYTQTAGVTTLVGGSTLNASAFNLNGGLLEGTGTIALGLNGDLIAQGGAQISPGNGAGTLALALSAGGDFILTNAVTASASAALLFELGSVSDLITVTGGPMHIGAGLMEFDDFAFTALGGFGAGIYTLIDGDTLINGSLGSSLSGMIGGYNASLAFADGGNDLVLSVSPIPEPGTAFAGLLLLGAGLCGRRRHR